MEACKPVCTTGRARLHAQIDNTKTGERDAVAMDQVRKREGED